MWQTVGPEEESRLQTCSYVVFKKEIWGARVAQSVECPTLAQVMILWFVGLSPVSGSVPAAQSLEPASDSGSPSLCPSPTHTVSLSLKNR